MKIFQYTAFWSPTEKEQENGDKPTMIFEQVRMVLASTVEQANLHAARAIPDEWVDKLEQVTLVVRPF